MYNYIRNSTFHEFDFELDERYNLGDTYEDSIRGKWVKLNDKLTKFRIDNPECSTYEVFYLTKNFYSLEVETVDSIKFFKLDLLLEYDKSENINLFYVGNLGAWIDRETRTSIMNTINIEKLLGKEATELWLNGTKLILSCDLAIQMLYQLEMYAKLCYNTTELHKANILKLTSVEAIKNYDFTKSYPEKLHFNI